MSSARLQPTNQRKPGLVNRAKCITGIAGCRWPAAICNYCASHGPPPQPGGRREIRFASLFLKVRAPSSWDMAEAATTSTRINARSSKTISYLRQLPPDLSHIGPPDGGATGNTWDGRRCGSLVSKARTSMRFLLDFGTIAIPNINWVSEVQFRSIVGCAFSPCLWQPFTEEYGGPGTIIDEIMRAAPCAGKKRWMMAIRIRLGKQGTG